MNRERARGVRFFFGTRPLLGVEEVWFGGDGGVGGVVEGGGYGYDVGGRGGVGLGFRRDSGHRRVTLHEYVHTRTYTYIGVRYRDLAPVLLFITALLSSRAPNSEMPFGRKDTSREDVLILIR